MQELTTHVLSAGQIAGAISAIAGVIALLLINPIRKHAAVRKKEKEEAAQFRKIVLEKLDGIVDDVADLQYERLSQAHDFYTSQGWCPTSKKTQLCNMYQSYTSKGRNHLSQRYEEDILGLPDKPKE